MAYIKVLISENGKQQFEAHCHALGEIPASVRIRELIFGDMRAHSDPLQVPILTKHRRALDAHFKARGSSLEVALATAALKIYQKVQSET
ncbi:MAG: hypothetical protein AAF773_00750 [Cyanobacteria bacterium P01_D01_bin.115]